MKRYEHLNLEYPTGKIIAKCTLTDCLPVEEELKKRLKEKDPLVYYGILKEDSTWKGYGFKLENIKKISPIPAKGKLSFWEYDLSRKN